MTDELALTEELTIEELTPRERAVYDLAVRNALEVAEHDRSILRKIVVAVAIVSAMVIGGVVLGWTAVEHESTQRAKQASDESKARALAIQQSRFTNTRDSCVDLTTRNHKTILALNSQLPKHPTKDDRDRIAAAILIINALVPAHKNCDKIASRRVNTKSNTIPKVKVPKNTATTTTSTSPPS